MYSLKGHTLDSIGCLDLQSGTLISGDGFQGAGVGRYRCFLECKEEYLKKYPSSEYGIIGKSILAKEIEYFKR